MCGPRAWFGDCSSDLFALRPLGTRLLACPGHRLEVSEVSRFGWGTEEGEEWLQQSRVKSTSLKLCLNDAVVVRDIARQLSN